MKLRRRSGIPGKADPHSMRPEPPWGHRWALVSVLLTAGLGKTTYLVAAPDGMASVEDDVRGKVLGTMRVYIAQRSLSLRRLLGAIVEQAGHTVVGSGIGESMLDAVTHREVDLALVDVDDGAVGGVMAVKLLRFEHAGLPPIPIYGVTSGASPALLQSCQDAHIDFLFHLPGDCKKISAALAGLYDVDKAASLSAPPSDASIASIASHPRFQINQAPRVQDDSYSYLRTIGGPDFIAEIAALFAEESSKSLSKLDRAVASRDERAFATEMSSIATSAAVLGAERLCKLCLAARDAQGVSFASQATIHATRIRSEVSQVVSMLEERMRANPKFDGQTGPA